MKKIPWRKHRGPTKRVPIQARSLEELDALIAKGREPRRVLQEAKKVRRNKVGGRASGAVRKAAALERAKDIGLAFAQLSAAGEKRILSKLARQFGVSRPTIYSALKRHPKL